MGANIMTGYCDGCGNQICICGVGTRDEVSSCITHHFACECREEQFKKIEAERDEYVAEAERFQHKCINLDQFNGMLKAEVQRLEKEREEYMEKAVRLTEALELYADSEGYDGFGCGCCGYETNLTKDCDENYANGKQARLALETYGVKDTGK